MKIAKRFFYTIMVISFFMYVSSPPLMALEPGELPAGGQIVSGSGDISSTGNQMTINQNTERMITEWSTFNIGPDAGVQFVQPGVSSAALNKIYDTSPSQIFGQLNANGQVFLLNSAGIIFGPTAQVNVGALVASSLNITNEDFMAGNYAFSATGTPGAVLNQGYIQVADGMYAAFLSPDVRNEGTINAPQGSVLMAAADKVNLDFNGDGLINYTVDKGAVDALAENKGLIKADGGLVVMTAKAVDDLTTAVVNNEGIIEAHTLQEKEGRILLLSDMESGETIVGGRLDASAPDGGDGGFIETSAHTVSYKDDFFVTAGAPFGNGGLWLIDPTDAAIDETIATGYVTTLDTGTSVLNDVTGNITLNSGVDIAKTLGGYATLTLKATENISLSSNSTISSTSNKLHVVLWSNSDATGTGYVAINTGSSISTNGGHLWMGGSASAGGSITWNGLTVGDGYALGNSTGNTDNNGVFLKSTTLTTSGGNIAMYGKSGTGSISQDVTDNPNGVRFASTGAVCVNSGTGTILIDGISQGSAGWCDGVKIDGNGSAHVITSAATSGNDAVTITGVGSTNGAEKNGSSGFYSDRTDSIRATGGGNIVLTGTAGNQGSVKIPYDVRLDATEGFSQVGAGDLIINANSFYNRAVISGTGNLIFRPRTDGTSIGIAGGAGTLSLPANYFSDLFNDDFSSITVGNSAAGAITVGAATTFRDSTTLQNSSTIAIEGAITANENLLLTSAGNITQSAKLDVDGTTTISNAGNNVTLNDATNDFTGAVSVTGADVSLCDTNAMLLGTSTISGGLTLVTSGALTQNGALVVTGTTGITAGSGNNITLDDSSNNFTGAVSVVSGDDVSLRDANAMDLGASTISGNLTLQTGGALTQSGALAVTGTTGVTAGAGNNVTLNTATNDFTGAVSVVSGDDVSLRDANAMELGASTISGDLTLQTAGALTQSGALAVTGTTGVTAGEDNNVTLDNASNDFAGAVSVVSGNDVALVDAGAIDLGASTVSGTYAVTATAGGGITNSGALDITGPATFTAADGQSIAVANAGNSFGSTVAFSGGTLANVSVLDTTAFDLAALTITGDLTATGAGLTQSGGNLIAPGTVTVTSTGANNILLDTAGNNFGTAVVTSAQNATLRDTDAVVLGAHNVTGDLAWTAGGAITQTGAVDVDGTTTISNAGNNVTLNDATNDFTGAVSVTGADVALVVANAIDLGASTVSGTYAVTATGGGVTNSGVLDITSAATFTAALGQSIAVANAGNSFSSTVAFASGGTLANVSVLDTTALDLAALTITGDLTATGAALTQSGILIAPGTATFTSTGANDILLNTAGNNFGTAVVTSAQNATLTDTNAVILGAHTVTGNLSWTAGGAITQTGALDVGGTTTISNAGNNVTLDTATNDFTGAVSVTGADVSLRDTNAMDLGASTVSGNFTLQTGGTLTQSGALAVTGTTGVTSGTNDVTLSNTGNDFGGTVTVVSAKDLNLVDKNAMSIGAVTSTGTVDIATLANDLTLTGAIETDDTTDDAVKLNAGKSASAGTATGGNIIIDGGTVTVGGGGRGTLYSGSVTDSTGLTDYIGSASGRFRYNSDETTTNYTTALGTGNYAVYREAPAATVTANDQTTYSGIAYSGGNGVTTGGFVNGDTAANTFGGTLAYSGTSQGATNEGTYTITPGGYTSPLGYGISYANGTLNISYKHVPSGATSSEFNKANDASASLYNTTSSLYAVQRSINGTQDGRLLFDTEQSEDSTNYMYDSGPMSGSGSVDAVSSYQLIIDRLNP